jgi:hypothetical protein
MAGDATVAGEQANAKSRQERYENLFLSISTESNFLLKQHQDSTEKSMYFIIRTRDTNHKPKRMPDSCSLLIDL